MLGAGARGARADGSAKERLLSPLPDDGSWDGWEEPRPSEAPGGVSASASSPPRFRVRLRRGANGYGRSLEPASCQGAWARLSEERPRGRMPGMSSTMCFWGAEEQAELSLEKKDLCCLFLNPGVKRLKIIISRRRGFKNMTRGGGGKKNPD